MNMFGFNAGSADERSVEVAEQIDKNDRVRLAMHFFCHCIVKYMAFTWRS